MHASISEDGSSQGYSDEVHEIATLPFSAAASATEGQRRATNTARKTAHNTQASGTT